MVKVKRQDKLNIDLLGLRERIVNCRSDIAWRNLSLAAKVRTLVEIGLEVYSDQPEQPQSIAELVDQHWSALIDYGYIPQNRLMELRKGVMPTASELVRLGSLVNNPELVIQLAAKYNQSQNQIYQDDQDNQDNQDNQDKGVANGLQS